MGAVIDSAGRSGEDDAAMASSAEPAFVVPESVLLSHVDDQMVLLNLVSERYYGLDAVGANILSRLTEQSFDDALSTLTAEYDVEPARLRTDIDALVSSLLDAGLLRRRTVDVS
jgi:hypothetical protein